jgi:pyruvate/2-oxoglutarate dehydrogenase complex dihydrolipoamide acyltransferase (E2) component
MTRLRQTIARRLKEAQNTAAMLTTFNEVDMSAVIELRHRYKDSFLNAHGVKLGFMSFFVQACTAALRAIPEVNAEIDGSDVIFARPMMYIALSYDHRLVDGQGISAREERPLRHRQSPRHSSWPPNCMAGLARS